jgi:hypothetical protein
MKDMLTYPEDPERIETGWETLDSILAVIEVFADFLDFYFGVF